MPKSLLVLRHAKAQPSSPDGSDIARPLSERGIKDAALLGKTLRKLELIPDRILCSPSTRTRQTAEHLLEKLTVEIAVTIEESIYEAGVGSLVHLIRHEEDADRLLLIGHNPGVEGLVSRLLTPQASLSIHMPTCGLARIDFEIDSWDDVVEHSGSLIWLTHPAILREI